MICLRGIEFGYDASRPVLRGVDLEFHAGERLGIVGPNGSGKTTLLHLIMGLEKPTAGEVEIFGQPRRHEADFHEVRRRIGLLFQDPDDQLFCPTVGEDVAFGPLNLGKSVEEAAEIVRKTLDMLGLQHLERRITYQLSGGEKRLVSLATVLAMQPEALLLDEPTNGLHEETVEQLIAILQAHIRSAIIISHDRAFLDRVTDRIAELRSGRLHWRTE